MLLALLVHTVAIGLAGRNPGVPGMLHSRNHAPAELPKQAASFDLPITLGILAGSGQLASELFDSYAVVGELALDRGTRPTKGVLSMAITAAQQADPRGMLVPTQNATEAAVVEQIEVIPVASPALLDCSIPFLRVIGRRGNAMGRRKKYGFSFSWKRASGLSAAKGKLSRKLGVPLTRSGRQRKLGRQLGCCIPVAVFIGGALAAYLMLA